MRLSRRVLLLVAVVVIASVLVGVVEWSAVNEHMAQLRPRLDWQLPEKSMGAPPVTTSEQRYPDSFQTGPPQMLPDPKESKQ